MMFDQKSFYQKGQKFLEELLPTLQTSIEIPAGTSFSLLCDHWDIDHLCYRTSTVEFYQLACQRLRSFAQLLSESQVNGRTISAFKLQTPFVAQGFVVDVVEVPSPKPGAHFSNGFEHLEIVADIPLAKIRQNLKEARLPYSDSGKLLNNELKVKFPSGNVKYHLLSLESLIRLETSPAYLAL
jgi:predicted metalloenzyme YecM